MQIRPQVVKREAPAKEQQRLERRTATQGSAKRPEKLVSLYPSLIVKRNTPSSGDSQDSNGAHREKRDSDLFRTQSRISFYRNEKLAEKISRNTSMKKVKTEADHLGILSMMDDKNKHQQSQNAPPEKKPRNEEVVEDPSQIEVEDLDSYLEKNHELLERNQHKLENYLELQSSILTKKMKDYDVSKMVIKESRPGAEDPARNLKKDLLTNNTTFVGQVDYNREFERKKKIFLTENVDEEGKRVPATRPAKVGPTRNTRYDNHLTESSQVPELKSKIGKKFEVLKSNSMKKFRHLDTNEVIQDCDEEMTNYQQMEEQQKEATNKADVTASEIIQNKLNQYMTTHTESSFSRRLPRVTNETTLGSIMDMTEAEIRAKFLTQGNRHQLDKYQMIRNQFRTNKANVTMENAAKSQYLRTVVQNTDLIGPNWETRIEEEGVEMGEIMMNRDGGLRAKQPAKEALEDKLEQLKEQQKINDMTFEHAKRNPNVDTVSQKEEPDVDRSIHSDLFDEKTPKKRKSSKSPEVLILMDQAPLKKRKFNLGKHRRKTPESSKRGSQKEPVKKGSNVNVETEADADEAKHETRDLSIEMPKELPKAIELDFGFEGEKRVTKWTRRAST